MAVTEVKQPAPAPAVAAAGLAGGTLFRSDLDDTTTQIVDSIVLHSLQTVRANNALLTGSGQLNAGALRPQLIESVRLALCHFQNRAYTAGYNSRVQRQQNISDRL